jgi:aspartate ammonia-lyase
MPGKVNPVIPEAVNQAAFQVIGNDMAIVMAAEAGQLQLNAMEPLIVYNLLSSLRILTKACSMFTTRCIVGITANVDHCEQIVRDSIGIVTAFSPFIGYEKATEMAGVALLTGRSVVDLIKEKRLLDEKKIEEIMKPENLTGPSSLISEAKIKRDRSQTHLKTSSVDFHGVPVAELFKGGHMRAVSLSWPLADLEELKEEKKT